MSQNDRGSKIHRMMTLSTGHIHPSLRATDDLGIGYAYPKAHHGWFVPVLGDLMLEFMHGNDPKLIPIGMAMALATLEECEWIMFDADGPKDPRLPYHD